MSINSTCQVDLIEAQVSSQSSLGGKMDALTVQVATQAMVGAKVEARVQRNYSVDLVKQLM